MRLLLILLISFGLVSCDSSKSFDAAAATKWSNQPDTQSRQTSSTYMFHRDDGSWVSISTSQMDETSIGLMYSGGEILKTGFYVYPGRLQVNSLKEAIDACFKIEGAEYQSEVSASDR